MKGETELLSPLTTPAFFLFLVYEDYGREKREELRVQSCLVLFVFPQVHPEIVFRVLLSEGLRST